MFLTNSDLVDLFPNSQGVNDPLEFLTVSTDATLLQPKGLFVPLFEGSGELQDAIKNGAIATVWDIKKKLPHYIPNHLPVFFTEQITDAFELILKHYERKLNNENSESINMTKFLFIEDKLLNENIPSYDIPVFKFVRNTEGGE
jgi:UDP-N-acetylmuramyl pentapeptide synthase